MRWTGPLGLTFLVAIGCGSDKTEVGDAPITGEQTDDAGRKRDGGRDASATDGSTISKPKPDSGSTISKGATGEPDGTIEPIVIDGCKPGAPLRDEQITALKAGGAPGNARFTYPYDGTVFPRGMRGPLIQWDGSGLVDSVYVHIKSAAFEYHGCLVPSDLNEVQIPDDVWDQAGEKTYGKRDPYSIELTVGGIGGVQGPIKQTWTIARATIKGSLYYNSYSSPNGVIGGAVYRIAPKQDAVPFVAFECNGCHSLAANGTRMTTQTLGLGARAYDISTGQPQFKGAPNNNAFSAMYPDGSHYLVGSQVIDIARTNVASPFGVASKAGMFETDTGNSIAMTGIPVDTLMPSFSSDGSLLVFNDYAIGSAHGLAAMDYDAKSHSASNYRQIVKLDNNRPGWPFALPDNSAVVYVDTDSIDFSAYGAGVTGGAVSALAAPFSDLTIVDLETGKSTVLAKAMGFANAAAAAAGTTYLPFGQEELHKNYFPTVSPVAAGGYFWIFWDSLRHYGNKGLSRQLWGTAVDIQAYGEIVPANGLYGDDHSHPAFYVPGQTFGSGNHRAFTALDPCKEEGASCETGVDCCSGSCDLSKGSPGVCGKLTSCAMSDERCETKADCCNKSDSCIAHFCSPVFL